MNVIEEIHGSQAAQFITDTPELFILDVRTEGEWFGGHIDGSTLIDVREFDEGLDQLPVDKERPIVCFCAHGIRSAAACNYMAQLGYTRLYNVEGGFSLYTGELVRGA